MDGVGQRAGVDLELTGEQQRGLHEVHPLVVVDGVVPEQRRSDDEGEGAGRDGDEGGRQRETICASEPGAAAAHESARESAGTVEG